MIIGSRGQSSGSKGLQWGGSCWVSVARGYPKSQALGDTKMGFKHQTTCMWADIVLTNSPIPRSHDGQKWPGYEKVGRCSKLPFLFWFSHFYDHRSDLQKLWSRRYFTSSSRDIGISFQLAITTPRLNLIGYGTATAQSWSEGSGRRLYTQQQYGTLVGFVVSLVTKWNSRSWIVLTITMNL